MTPRVLYDYAINTGSLYKQHLDMATEVASIRVWELHVRVNILLAYRRENHEPYEGMSIAELLQVATELQHYYSAHVGEMHDGS